jgi:CRISPR-associated endonuclease/helicase Cas3
MDFDAFFEKATDNRPFPYQRCLALNEPLYQLLDVPTGAGKTAAVILAWLWRRRFAEEAVRQATPRRLVYCLPMRTLVEQTEAAAQTWLRNLGQDTDVRVYVLMGGEEVEDWDISPERDAILIGTQDMLLSRALNRGYGMSRYRWPIHFGLLNNDCLWVLDEIQLMSSGLATSTQLQAFRDKLGAWGPDNGPVKTIWMSATLRPDWLATVDFKDRVAESPRLGLSEDDRSVEALSKRLAARKRIDFTPCASVEEPKKIAALITEAHKQRGALTLVVVNTVERAQSLYDAIGKIYEQPVTKARRRKGSVPETTETQPEKPELLLIHSRFRPPDRRKLNQQLILADKVCRREPLPSLAEADQLWVQSIHHHGLIVVATQVVEAGVDISAKTLFTELAPWPSLVQRFGRCNRFGEFAEAQVFWIGIPPDKKGLAAPYDEDELLTARRAMESSGLCDVGPTSLANYIERMSDEERGQLFSYQPIHVIRRKDIIELFDTTPDLAGNDIDIARFIRNGRELDVQIFWREVAEGETPSADEDNGKAPRREELCSVPCYSFRDSFLGQKKLAYRWDVLEKQWQRATAEMVFPGQVFLIPSDQGGYNAMRGWDPSSKGSVAPIPALHMQASEGNDDDIPSQDTWQTIADHSSEVVAELGKIADSLGFAPGWREVVETAARWHDRGKAHAVFQEAILDGPPGDRERPDSWRGRRDLAKAPEHFWRKHYNRKHFRHELATALAMLQAGLSPLATYLAAAHHGKVRLSIRSLPDERHPPEPMIRFARGVWDLDTLPETDLGGWVIAPAVDLSLEPMELGIGASGRPSWAERVLRLRDDPQLSIFRLALLEAVLRVADWRASEAHRRKDCVRDVADGRATEVLFTDADRCPVDDQCDTHE